MITRRHALALGAALAVRPAAALAADTDTAPLTALAAYHQEVVDQYGALLQGPHRATLQQLRRRAAGALAALPKPPPLPSPAGTTLETLIAAEEALVGGCYTALQSLTGDRHLKGCAAFMTDAGRRLVVLRGLAGQPLLPRAFETGVT